jgi:hypothetical protein
VGNGEEVTRFAPIWFWILLAVAIIVTPVEIYTKQKADAESQKAIAIFDQPWPSVPQSAIPAQRAQQIAAYRAQLAVEDRAQQIAAPFRIVSGFVDFAVVYSLLRFYFERKARLKKQFNSHRGFEVIPLSQPLTSSPT